MNKSAANIFDFLRSTVHFCKILTLAAIMMHLLYWIQHLTGSNWDWMNFLHGFLDSFIKAGEKISDGSFDVAGTEFEYKYFFALALYGAVYFLFNVAMRFTDETENCFDDAKELINRKKEDALNKQLNKQQKKEESQIKKYKVLIKTSLKKRFDVRESGISLNEQNVIMNKFLTEKFEIQPELFEGGFLYSFSDFNKVERVLEVLFKLVKSDAPLDYIICLQASENEFECMDKLKTLADLNIVNKIIMLSETAYRYSFNSEGAYRAAQIGLYQKGEATIEVCEFTAD